MDQSALLILEFSLEDVPGNSDLPTSAAIDLCLYIL